MPRKTERHTDRSRRTAKVLFQMDRFLQKAQDMIEDIRQENAQLKRELCQAHLAWKNSQDLALRLEMERQKLMEDLRGRTPSNN